MRSKAPRIDVGANLYSEGGERTPCGVCPMGTYDVAAMVTKEACVFGAMNRQERIKAMPSCLRNKHLRCDGAVDFHNLISSLRVE